MKKIYTIFLILLALFSFGACSNNQASNETDQSYIYHLEKEELDNRLKNAKLSILLGGIDEVEIPKLYPNATILTYSSNADKLFALLSGKVDYSIASSSQATLYSRNNNYEYEYCDAPLYTMGNSFALQEGNVELKTKIDECINSLKEDGTLDELNQKWVIDGKYSMDDVPYINDENAPVLIVATDGASEPFSFIYNNQLAGHDVELISRIANMMGMRIEFSQMSFSSTIVAVTTGKADVALNITPTEERDKQVDFSDIYYEVNIVALSKKDGVNSSLISNIKDSFISTFISENRWMMFVDGIKVTLTIALFSFILATLVGILLCLMLLSKNKAFNKLASIYVRIACGVPILVWLMLLYYVVFNGINISSIIVSIIALGLQSGASLSGIFKTGIDSIDVGQKEAAEALGFSSFMIYTKIIIPQAILRVFDLYKGEFVSLVKTTSIVGYVAINDITKVSDLIRSRTYEAFFPLITTALIYFVITYLIVVLLNIVQKRVNPKFRKTILKGVKVND